MYEQERDELLNRVAIAVEEAKKNGGKVPSSSDEPITRKESAKLGRSKLPRYFLITAILILVVKIFPNVNGTYIAAIFIIATFTTLLHSKKEISDLREGKSSGSLFGNLVRSAYRFIVLKLK